MMASYLSRNKLMFFISLLIILPIVLCTGSSDDEASFIDLVYTYLKETGTELNKFVKIMDKLKECWAAFKEASGMIQILLGPWDKLQVVPNKSKETGEKLNITIPDIASHSTGNIFLFFIFLFVLPLLKSVFQEFFMFMFRQFLHRRFVKHHPSILPKPHSQKLPTKMQLSLPQTVNQFPKMDNHVFMCYRDASKSKKFVRRLSMALNKSSIQTFEGTGLGSIRDERKIRKQLDESKVWIIVFSKEFAHFVSCLKLLVMIMKRRNVGQTVVAIFYDVAPQEVKEQTGSYQNAFARYEKAYLPDTVKEWRKALQQVAYLEPVFLHESDELQSIQRIAQEIGNRLTS